jgi:hypothetical protein
MHDRCEYCNERIESHYAKCRAIPALFDDIDAVCDFCNKIVDDIVSHYATCTAIPDLMPENEFWLARQAFADKSQLFRCRAAGDPALVLETVLPSIMYLLGECNAEENCSLKAVLLQKTQHGLLRQHKLCILVKSRSFSTVKSLFFWSELSGICVTESDGAFRQLSALIYTSFPVAMRIKS